MSGEWIAVDEALEALGVQRQSLYAYVSRGLIRARADEGDPRRSLYSARDVQGLKGRKRGAKRRSEVAAGAIAWGDPVLESALSTVRDGELIYRGRRASELSARATLEDVARLLWGEERDAPGSLARVKILAGPVRARAFAFLAQRAASDPPSLGRSPAALRQDAWRLLDGFAAQLCGAGMDGLLHARLAAAWGLGPRGAAMVRRVLVLMADHELNASTFAVRIAASTGAPLAACALAGLSTLAGPLHGEAAARALVQLDALLGADDPRRDVRAMIGRGEAMAGLGQPLYPMGDPRAKAMLSALRPRAAIMRVIKALEAETGEFANCDAALSAMTRELDLPDDAPFVLFALARMVGWLAHAMEQRETGRLIRPRARYVGQ